MFLALPLFSSNPLQMQPAAFSPVILSRLLSLCPESDRKEFQRMLPALFPGWRARVGRINKAIWHQTKDGYGGS
jgi:hypothetical protein